MDAYNENRLLKNTNNSHSAIEDAATDMINDGKRLAHEVYEQGRRKIHQVEKNAKDYSHELVMKVREKPLAAILISAGLGFILSTLLRK